MTMAVEFSRQNDAGSHVHTTILPLRKSGPRSRSWLRGRPFDFWWGGGEWVMSEKNIVYVALISREKIFSWRLMLEKNLTPLYLREP